MCSDLDQAIAESTYRLPAQLGTRVAPKLIESSQSHSFSTLYNFHPHDVINLLVGKACSWQGPHLAMTGEPRGFSRVAAGFSNYAIAFSKNTGVGSNSLLQGIFPTQVSCIAGRFFTIWTTREDNNQLSGSWNGKVSWVPLDSTEHPALSWRNCLSLGW